MLRLKRSEAGAESLRETLEPVEGVGLLSIWTQ